MYYSVGKHSLGPQNSSKEAARQWVQILDKAVHETAEDKNHVQPSGGTFKASENCYASFRACDNIMSTH